MSVLSERRRIGSAFCTRRKLLSGEDDPPPNHQPPRMPESEKLFTIFYFKSSCNLSNKYKFKGRRRSGVVHWQKSDFQMTLNHVQKTPYYDVILTSREVNLKSFRSPSNFVVLLASSTISENWKPLNDVLLINHKSFETIMGPIAHNPFSTRRPVNFTNNNWAALTSSQLTGRVLAGHVLGT